jgi:hypothetical protein
MHWQARAAAEQGMRPIATQEPTGMMSGGMTQGRIGISSAPSQEGGAINEKTRVRRSDGCARHARH